jgi:hypothetical protein
VSDAASSETRAGRPFLAGAVAVAFFTTGLWFAGGATRVSALVHAAAWTPGIEPMPGSHAGTPRSTVVDGIPARVRSCVAPKGTTIGAVRDYFDRVASSESQLGRGHELPHSTVDQGALSLVLWTSRDGHRRSVIALEEAGLVRYTLVDGDPLPAVDPNRSLAESSVVLPGGIQAPEGARPELSVDDGLQGFAFFEAPGSPDAVAAQLRASIERARFEVDARTQAGIEAVQESTSSRSEPGRVVISFQGKNRKGCLVVAPARPGLSRVTLALR